MIYRNIILLFNVVGLLLYSLIFNEDLAMLKEDIDVTQNIPASVAAGSEFTVELTLKKSNVTGFAKLQQELPEGLTATAIESATGNFSFNDKVVKIIWMSLPPEKEFKISYKVTVPTNFTGSTASIAGKISFLENNEKKIKDISAASISITGGSTAAATPAPTETAQTNTPPPSETPAPTTSSSNTPAETNSPAAANTSASSQSSPSTSSEAPPSGSLDAVRNFPASGGKEFTVTITVKKGSVSGFAKLEETLPKGLSAAGVETSGGVFSFVDQKVKFLWMSLPTGSEFKVSYKVTADASFSGSPQINGVFSYLENDETKKAVIRNGEGAPASGGDLAAVSTSPSPEPQSQPEPAPAPAPKTKSKPKKQSVVTSTPNAQNGIVFRVQITATHKTGIETSYFTTTYSNAISGEVFSEMHEGWYKFTTGNHNEYSSARDMRETIKGGNGELAALGPFVTAYNSGTRITVQEALMISRQRWVQ